MKETCRKKITRQWKLKAKKEFQAREGILKHGRRRVTKKELQDKGRVTRHKRNYTIRKESLDKEGV